MDLGLQPNEGIIFQSDNVRHGSSVWASSNDELILTNINIIYVAKNAFGKVKNIQKYPLNQLKVVNGQPQVMMGKNSQGGPQLQFYFRNGQESFEFSHFGRKEISKWIDGIYQAVTGNPVPATDRKNFMAIPGTEQVVGTVKDTIGAFKDALGLKSKGNFETGNVTVKCIGCMAPLSGAKGETVRCKYCDTEQTL